jgi:gamma-glutamylcyclotransferase (GGCT)/AIG2-like uncharacterized protein YtfP
MAETNEGGRGDRERWWSPAWIGAIAAVASTLIAAVALFAASDSGPDEPEPSAQEATHYFMYGTMMPGHLRYPEIDDFVESTTRDRVAGHLFDSGLGYPAATFDAGETEVEGYVLRILPGEEAEAAKTIADQENNLFSPVTVETRGGTEAIAYEWVGSTEGLEELPDGVWDREEA